MVEEFLFYAEDVQFFFYQTTQWHTSEDSNHHFQNYNSSFEILPALNRPFTRVLVKLACLSYTNTTTV